jgi:transcriptional antiterminator NusG
MAKKWYVVHTYSGYENRVKMSLEERIKLYSKEDFFGEILVPSESVVEVVRGKKRNVTKSFYPGYILVNMELTDDTWYIVRNTPKVTGFVGGNRNPVPLSDDEVKEIMTQIETGILKKKHKAYLEKGESVKVIDGPFTNFSGIVDEVKPEKGKIRVLVSVFGRATPVELDIEQVERG